MSIVNRICGLQQVSLPQYQLPMSKAQTQTSKWARERDLLSSIQEENLISSYNPYQHTSKRQLYNHPNPYLQQQKIERWHHQYHPYYHLVPPTQTQTNSELTKISQNLITKSNVTTSRRIATLASVGTLLLAREAIFNTERAYGFEFRKTVPDQTLEEAEGGIKSHAQDLLNVKEFIELESWKEAQKQLRKSSSLLKQDIYTIIQTKPGEQRPLLRKLYSQLFNNVTSLDYAARSKDEKLVKEYYDNIVVSLDAILSRM